MLYHAIKKLEHFFPFFNRKALTADDLLVWCELLGLKVITDLGVEGAFTFKPSEEKLLIVYNPHLPPDKLVLVLGHEIGHYLLGHTKHAKILFSPTNVFCKTGLEKDAGIIGFLCWLPTKRLKRLLRNPDCYYPEGLAQELATCDSEWQFLVKACSARLRIYNALKRVEENRSFLTA